MDHEMHFTLTEEDEGQKLTFNFSYEFENESPEAIPDSAEKDASFIIPQNSQNVVQLDVLKNDTIDGQLEFTPGLLVISGLNPMPGLYSDVSPQFTYAISITDDSVITLTPPTDYLGWLSFFYTIEDGEGNRDFASADVFVTDGIDHQIMAEDDRVPIELGKIPETIEIEVLANDRIGPPGAFGQLVIDSFSQPGLPGAEISTINSNRKLLYKVPSSGLSVDSFTYTVTDGDSRFDTANVNIVVGTFDFPDDTDAQSYQGREFAMQTPEGDSRVTNLFTFCGDLLGIFTVSFLGGQTRNTKPDQPEKQSFELQIQGTPETEDRLLRMFADFQPGFSALLAGQGETETISFEMIENVKYLMDYALDRAKPALKDYIQEQAAMFNGLDDFVGKNFNEWAQMLDLDPEKVTIMARNSGFIDGKFSISTDAVPGLNYRLWQSTNLQADDWVEVTDAEKTEEGLKVTLIDPTPDLSSDRIFYRLTNEIE